jgi:hypothetical protein
MRRGDDAKVTPRFPVSVVATHTTSPRTSPWTALCSEGIGGKAGADRRSTVEVGRVAPSAMNCQR